jgi:GGDEF domain-containing protein
LNVGIITNITADALIKVIADDEIRFLAFYVSIITRLLESYLLKDRLSGRWTCRYAPNRWLCVIFIDLDSFKIINDSLGHDQER